jgi:DegV family protein with EDD domain
MACAAAAEVRAEYPDRKIEVLDSKRAAIAEGFVVMVAAQLAAKGKTLPLVLQSAREACRRSSIAITLETLEYLARGGRIGKAAYLLSSLINIKPILTINNEGTVSTIGKVRSINHALQAIVDYVARQVKGCKKFYVAIMEADATKHAARLKDLVIQKLHPTKIMHTDFTPVMGVHAGPGAVGLGFYYE